MQVRGVIRYGFFENRLQFFNNQTQITGEQQPGLKEDTVRSYSKIVGIVLKWLGYAAAVKVEDGKTAEIFYVNKKSLKNFVLRINRRRSDITVEIKKEEKITKIFFKKHPPSPQEKPPVNSPKEKALTPVLTPKHDSILTPPTLEIESPKKTEKTAPAQTPVTPSTPKILPIYPQTNETMPPTRPTTPQVFDTPKS